MNQRKLLELIHYSADAMIPYKKLTDEQQDKLMGITYDFCSCKLCKNVMAHANIKTWKIGISKFYFNTLTKGPSPVPITLLELISSTLHEIIHILFPTLSEKQVERKTKSWIRQSKWYKF
jgi:hypothetical protein